MIRMHPEHRLLQQFAAGELPASLSTAIAVHLEFCSACRAEVELITEQLAESTLVETFNEMPMDAAVEHDALFAEMIADITSDSSLIELEPVLDVEIEVAGNSYTLPRALHSVAMSGWQRLGRFSRSRLDFNEGSVHSNILYIAPGGSVPKHTHKGFELTLLLSGSFSDEQGSYQAGDFIMLDQSHHHTPFSEEGCLCMTVADDAMHFTQGVGRLFNPLIDYLY